MTTSSGNTFRLFVYGTLMREGKYADVLVDQRYLGPARTRPVYRLLDLGTYPGLVRSEGGLAIEGELYEVDASLLGMLDWIEGAPWLFRLEAVELDEQEGPVSAFFYRQATAETAVYPGQRWHNSGVG